MIAPSWWVALDRVGFEAMGLALSALWQSSVLLAAVALLGWGLRRRRAAVRHALWAAALLAAPLLPLLAHVASGLGTPRAEIPVLPAYAAPAPPVPPPATLAAPDVEAVETPAPPIAAPRYVPPSAVRRTLSLADCPWAFALLAYAAGAAAFLALVAVGRLRLGRWVRTGRAVTDPRVLAAFADVARLGEADRFPPRRGGLQAEAARAPTAKDFSHGSHGYHGSEKHHALGRRQSASREAMGSASLPCRLLSAVCRLSFLSVSSVKSVVRFFLFPRRVAVVESGRVHAPLTVGVLRPAVLLPLGLAERLSDAELRAVTTHELAHVRRGDPLLLTLVSLVRAVLFFHPLVWLAARQVASLAEQAADDAVLEATGEPLPYAKLLARIAEGLPRRALATELAAGFVLSKSAFLRRVEAILSDRRAQIRRLTRWALAATLLAALLCLLVPLALPLGAKSVPPPVVVENRGPLDIRLVGICPDGSDDILDASGKKIAEWFGPGDSNRDARSTLRTFIFSLPRTAETPDFSLFQDIGLSGSGRHLTSAGGGFLVDMDGEPRLLVFAAVPQTYSTTVLGVALRDNPVERIDLTLRYYYGPARKPLMRFTGPFTLGKAVAADNGQPGDLTPVRDSETDPSRRTLFRVVSRLQFGTQQVTAFDTQGRRLYASIGSHGSSGAGIEGELSVLDAGQRAAAPGVPLARIGAVSLGEPPHEITFRNIPVAYPGRPVRSYPEYQDRIAAALGLPRIDPEKPASDYVQTPEQAIRIVELARNYWIPCVHQMLARGPVDFATLPPESQASIRRAALAWTRSPFVQTRAWGVELGLKGHWHEFVAPALALLDTEECTESAHALRRCQMVLTTADVRALADRFLREDDPRLSAYRGLVFQSKAPGTVDILWDLARAADDRPWLWLPALSQLDSRQAIPPSWPLSRTLRLRLARMERAQPGDEALAPEAGRLSAELLTPRLAQMDSDLFLGLYIHFIRKADRATATATILRYLRSAEDPRSVYWWPDRMVRQLNQWYGTNFGGLGANTERDTPEADRYPWPTIIAEVLRWDAARTGSSAPAADGKKVDAATLPAKADEPAWGEAVEGTRVGLRAEKRTWQVGQSPRFTTEVRHHERKIVFGWGDAECELELDGEWFYLRVDDHPVDRIVLDGMWASKGTRKNLSLAPGKHVLRVGISGGIDGKMVRAISGPIEITVVDGPAGGPAPPPKGQAEKGGKEQGAAPAPPAKAEEPPWGEAKGGLRSRVVLGGRSFKQGEPIQAGIEVENAGEKPVAYDPRPVEWAWQTGFPRFTLTGPDGKAPAHIGADAQIWTEGGTYRYPTLKPGEKAGFPARVPLDEVFYLRRPGRYRLQWMGQAPAEPNPFGDPNASESAATPLPPSQAVEFEVTPAPGGAPDGDLVGRLLAILPPGWKIRGSAFLADNARVSGCRPCRGSYIGLVHRPAGAGLENNSGMAVWVTPQATERDPKSAEPPAEYLGEGALGHVYLLKEFGEPDARWPGAAQAIGAALGLANPAPAEEKGEKRGKDEPPAVFPLPGKDPAPAPAKAEEPPWGEAVGGLRLRVTAPNGTTYRRGTRLPLVFEVENVGDKPIPFERMGLNVTVEATDEAGKPLPLRTTFHDISPWEGRADAFLPGKALSWGVPFDRLSFREPPKAGTAIRLRVHHVWRGDPPPAPGQTPRLWSAFSNSVHLAIEEALPAPLGELPDRWTDSMAFVYRESGGVNGYHAVEIEGDGRVWVVVSAGRQRPWPPGRVKAELSRDRLDRFAKFLREQKVWEIAQPNADVPEKDHAEMTFILVSAGASLVLELPWREVKQQPALLALEREVAALITEAVAEAKRAEENWGEAVDGVRCRLRADKDLWWVGDAPTLKADVRNDGPREWIVWQTEALWELDVDGVAYRWAGDIGAKSSWLAPGRQYSGIRIELGGRWSAVAGGGPPSLKPGKHVVRVAPKVSPWGGNPVQAIRVVSKPVEITIADAPAAKGEAGPGGKQPVPAPAPPPKAGEPPVKPPGKETAPPAAPGAKADEPPWGEAAQGLRCRLSAEQPVWKAGEAPKLTVDVRNDGTEERLVADSAQWCKLEWDGNWYGWGVIDGRMLPLAPGRQNSFSLGLRKGAWFGEKGPLELRPGKHTVRVAFGAEPRRRGEGQAFRVVSNPVEISILDEKDAAGWGEAAEGVQCRLRADRPEWKVGEAPTFRADLLNRGNRGLSVVAGLYGYDVEIDGQWHRWPAFLVIIPHPLRPGQEYSGILVRPTEAWCVLKGGQLQTSDPLRLGLGKHVVRIAFRPWPAELNRNHEFRVISNPVEIVVAEGEPGVAPASPLEFRAVGNVEASERTPGISRRAFDRCAKALAERGLIAGGTESNGLWWFEVAPKALEGQDIVATWRGRRYILLCEGHPMRVMLPAPRGSGQEWALADVRVEKDAQAGWRVALSFDERGRSRFANLTGWNVGGRVGILVGGRVVSAPLIRQRVSDIATEGRFTEQEARELAAGLRAAAGLPAPDAKAQPVGARANDTGWGEAKGGLRSRVVLEPRSFKQGEPIQAGIEVENTGEKPVAYDPRPVERSWQTGSPRFTLTGPDGKTPARIGTEAQIVIEGGTYRYPTLKPGERIGFPARRLDRVFYPRRTGRYRLQWMGEAPAEPNPFGDPNASKSAATPLPPSQVVEFEVTAAPGGGPDGDLVGRLLAILPPGWKINGATLLADNARVAGCRPCRGSWIGLVHRPMAGLLDNNSGLSVWVTPQAAERDPQSAEPTPDHLGQAALGHVYLRKEFGDPDARWPGAARAIGAALGLGPPRP